MSETTTRSTALVVLPCYNERDNLLTLAEQIFGLGLNLDILVIDDASPDGTGELAEHLRATYPRLYVMHRPRKLGLGTAYKAGFRYGLNHGYAHVITMDADLSHQPRQLHDLVEAGRDADFVIGSRYTPGGGAIGWPLRRKIISGTANRLARAVLGISPSDCTSGYRCYSRDALLNIEPETVLSSGYSFLVEMLYRVEQAGLSVREVPIIFVDRVVGKSKISRIEIYKTLFTLARLRFPLFPWGPVARAGEHVTERGAMVALSFLLCGALFLWRKR